MFYANYDNTTTTDEHKHTHTQGQHKHKRMCTPKQAGVNTNDNAQAWMSEGEQEVGAEMR
jgi:hypothetical protein